MNYMNYETFIKHNLRVTDKSRWARVRAYCQYVERVLLADITDENPKEFWTHSDILWRFNEGGMSVKDIALKTGYSQREVLEILASQV
tara:strand:+ start:537 stop:800 length:264 start_codon:yes stop_codon:yes gene_type:complete